MQCFSAVKFRDQTCCKITSCLYGAETKHELAEIRVGYLIVLTKYVLKITLDVSESVNNSFLRTWDPSKTVIGHWLNDLRVNCNCNFTLIEVKLSHFPFLKKKFFLIFINESLGKSLNYFSNVITVVGWRWFLFVFGFFIFCISI